MSEQPQTNDAGDAVWRQFTRGNAAWDRLLVINDALEIVQATGFDPKGCEEIAKRRDDLDASLTKIRTLKPGDDGFDETLAAFESDGETTERMLMRLDGRIPFAQLRKTFDTQQFRETTVARYVSLLVRYIDDAEERRDHIDFLATRLFSVKMPKNRLAIRPYSDVFNILRSLVPDAERVDGSEHGQAVTFFREAIRRLDTFTSMDALFESGFYVDVRGYKISLRDEFLDPDVLYAAAELNTAIHNKMQTFKEMEGVGGAELTERIGEQEQKIKEIFHGAEVEEEVTHARFNKARIAAQEEATKRKKRRPKKKKKEKASQKKGWIRLAVQLSLIALVTASGVYVTSVFFRNRNELVEASNFSLTGLSPLLESGSFTEGKDHKMFSGTFVSRKWVTMSKAERSDAAEALAARLKEEGVLYALIFRDGTLAVQIDAANVVMVE